MKTKQQIENCLISDLQNMKYEVQSGNVDMEMIFGFFSEILLDAEVDSKIIVNVLEQKNFGDMGKEYARYIKVDEGW